MLGTEVKPLVPRQRELDHPLIIRHERRILALKRSQAELNVESIVEIGTLLREVKETLKFGFWGQWLKDHVRFSHSLAGRYMGLANFAASNSETFPKMKPLGPNKLHELSRLSSSARARMLSRDLHVVGPDGIQKTLEQMSVVEFRALARAMNGTIRHLAPRTRELIRRGVQSAERLCTVLQELGHRRRPECPNSDRFGSLLTKLRTLLEAYPHAAAPAQR